MSGEAKSGGASGGAGGFRSRMEHYLYSGDKKHVAAGIVIFGIIFGIPWALMNRASIRYAQALSCLPLAIGTRWIRI
ncbi:hypothetical protein Csa_016217 [Cucumis sativus]|uniref:Uncharacterized protein n=1 Tax=Cucumis sativus TaxID=3659 RepID=A0A0A0K8K9_CUCSA|nr:hypothetical protein Csa_016217 [Cucumis sativus]